MEIHSGPPGPGSATIETSSGVDLPIHAKNLVEARNHLVATSQQAKQWALEHPEHPASYLLTRSDVGEQTKIQALRRIETVSLPAEVRDLLEAARYFNDCQAESQAAFDAESITSEHELPADGSGDVVEGAHAAYLNLLRGYRNWGGFGYHGWTDRKDPDSYPGPAIWNRQDIVFRFGRALERELPERVHLGLKISRATSSTFDPDLDRQRSFDVAVTVPGLFGRDLSQRQFRNLRHDLFVEVDWLKKGRWLNTEQLVKRCGRIQQDLLDLQRSIDRGRCEFAAMLIVDDEGFLDFHGDLIKWPPDVIPLILSPSAIVEQGLGNGDMDPTIEEIEQVHHAHCPCADGPLAIA